MVVGEKAPHATIYVFQNCKTAIHQLNLCIATRQLGVCHQNLQRSLFRDIFHPQSSFKAAETTPENLYPVILAIGQIRIQPFLTELLKISQHL